MTGWAAEATAATTGVDLVRDFDGLSQLLLDRLGKGEVLDAFLAAAGMNQIVEDHLHRDLGELKKAARHIRELGAFPAEPAGVALAGLGGLLQRTYPATREHRVIRLQVQLAELVANLAGQAAGIPAWGDGPGKADALVQALDQEPLPMRRSLIRLPACFAVFDQRPADVRQLAMEFSERWPDRDRPLAIIGVRTSGCYLAPLAAAFLRSLGYQNVEVGSWRPEQEWLAGERRRLKATVRAGGLGLIIDDPPSSGRILARAASTLQRIGVRHENLVLLFAALKSPDGSEWPQRLQGYHAVVLPWEQWAIHEHLAPLAARRALSEILIGRRVAVIGCRGQERISVGAIGDIERMPVPSPSGARDRGHGRALYRVQLIEQGTGRTVEQHVYARGLGLGYLGAASVGVADQLKEFIAPVYGARDGVLYRAWLPAACRLDAIQLTDDQGIADDLVRYAVTRARRLRVPEPTSRRLVTDSASWRATVWQDACQLLSTAFGRGALVARAAMRSTSVRLLPADDPAIVDGNADTEHWFLMPNGSGHDLLKTGFDDGAYRAGTIHCYDPLIDVATAAAGRPDEFADALWRAFLEQSGWPVSPERWLIYRLLATQRWWQSHGGPTDGRYVSEMARLLQRYIGTLYLSDVAPSPDGPLCAIDIDGVLETSCLGFPATTPAGALALRALAAHGFRVVLVSGRSLDDIRDRCRNYRLAGGVAEYGAAIYDHGSGAVRPLISEADQSRLAHLRMVLSQVDGVHLDPAFRHAVRAYQLRSGRRCHLDRETMTLAVKAADFTLAIEGRNQTDFVTASFDKGTGLRALTAQLSGGPAAGLEPVVALAVGDSASDLPMLGMASRGILTRAHQRGLLDAVSGVVGHRPGGCPVCRRPALSADARCLLDILAVEDLGRWGKGRRLLALMLGDRSEGDELEAVAATRQASE